MMIPAAIFGPLDGFWVVVSEVDVLVGELVSGMTPAELMILAKVYIC